MLGNFTYYNPTKLYFGEHSLDFLKKELTQYGPVVMLCYGGGSIKRNGIYDSVTAILKEAGKKIVEDPGVMPNPTIEKLLEGARIARENNVDLILAVGGGSVVDYAKGVAASAWCTEDPWEKYYLKEEDPDCRLIPIGAVLTMVGTGSEMNGGSVITNPTQRLKIGKVFGPENFPKFTVLNPKFTYTVPRYQMIAGIYDIMCHIHEQYFSGTDDNTSDYIAEGLMRSLINSSRVAVKNPEDYEARSNIMWTATWALNTMLKMGKSQDWEVHMIGQAISAVTDATHGMTLSAVTLPYFKRILADGLPKFVRYAQNVWGIRADGKSPLQIAEEGLHALESWMKELGLVLNVRELGVTEENIPYIVESTFLLDSGYRQLTKQEVADILKESLL